MSKTKKGPVAVLAARAEELEHDNAKQRDKYLRALAEFENYRVRRRREVEETTRFAREELMTEILPVLDNLDRALSAAEQAGTGDGFHRGVEMIQRQLKDVLVRFGLEEFTCLGDEFDPRNAEAVSFVPTDTCDCARVVEEQCRGYRCDGRVIRPARVVVSKPAQANGATPPEVSPDGCSACEDRAATED